MSIYRFENEIKQINNIMNYTYKFRKDKIDIIFDIFNRLCLLGDISEDIYRVDAIDLPFFITQLTVRTFLEFQACIFEGAYYSAGRTLRWLYETNLTGATARIHPILLDKSYSAISTLDLEQFEKYLEKYDEGVVKFNHNSILKFLTLSVILIYTEIYVNIVIRQK